MNKTPSHLISCDSRSGGLAGVCLAPAITDFEFTWQRRNDGKTIGTDLNRHPLALLSSTRRYDRRRCAKLKSP